MRFLQEPDSEFNRPYETIPERSPSMQVLRFSGKAETIAIPLFIVDFER